MAACQTAGERVFHDGGKHGVGHHEATRTATLEAMGEDAEGIGITLEVGDVVPESR